MEYNLYKYNPLFKKDILNIYHSWININKSLYIKYYNLIGLILMALLIPVDYILYGENQDFSLYRVIYIIIIMINLLYIQVYQDNIFKLKDKYTIQYNLLLPGLLYNLLYVYYLCICTPEQEMLVLLANFITIIATTMFAMKFWKVQYLINLISILSIVGFYIYMNDLFITLYLLTAHLISFIVAFLYRRSFILRMYERYCNTASMVPKNVAKHIAITDGTVNLNEIFKPTKRFTVCMSSDWRNFQKIAKNNDPEYIEQLFQNFYNIVFEELDRIFPLGNYYADWTADEMFIIFYSDTDKDKVVVQNALEFAYIYATKIFEKINSNLDSKLLYDIGLASGIGLLGLQGPEKLKKTTITGESAGLAKRFETEAKNHRIDDKKQDPIIIINEIMKEIYENSKLDRMEFIEVKGTVKNIENHKLYMWKNN